VQLPLSDVIVLDMSRALAGPHAGMMLADLGATVIKIERPGSGDDTRHWGPPFVEDSEGQEQATYYLACNRNKQSLALYLKNAHDKRVFRQLVSRADVLIENFRAGVMDRLGFSETALQSINPRLVQLSISGFGHDGPESSRAGYDQIVQGEAGLMSLTGEPDGVPQRVGVPIADLLSGIHGVVGVLAALLERNGTGKGKIVRTSLLASIVGVHSFQGTRQTVAHETPTALGNHHPSIAPYGLFHCGDGASVQMSVGNEALWERFCAEFDLDPTTMALENNGERVRNRDETIRFVEDAFAPFKASEVVEKLNRAGVPVGVVRNLSEVYEWEQVASQGLRVNVEHPTLGEISLPGSPLRFFEIGGEGLTETTKQEHSPPPLLDQHRESVLRWLGSNDA